MRGRTNIPNRKDPIINGDVENFVVAQNNVITKGDFVSVVRESGYRTLSNVKYSVIYKRLYDVVNKKSVLVIKSDSGFYYAVVMQCTSGGVQIITQTPIDNVINTSVRFDFNTYNNTLYYTNNVGTSHQSYGVIYSYAIVNNEFVAQNAISLPNKPTDGIYALAVFGNNQDIAIIHGTSFYFRVYSKVNDVYTYASLDVASITNPNSNNAVYAASGDNCAIVLGYSNQSGARGDHVVKFYNYSSTNATIEKLEVNTTRDAIYYSCDFEIVGDTFFYVGNVRYNASSSSAYWYKPFVAIFDISGNTLSAKFLEEFTTVTPSWSFWWIDYGDDNEFLIQSFSRYGTASYGVGMSGYIVLTEDNQGVFSFVVSQYQDLIVPQAGMISFTNNDEIKAIAFATDTSSSSGVVGIVEYSLTVVDNEIVIGQPTNFVKAYDGKGSIGFAKTDGVAGDTIQIYVPHNNS